jgi:hypothetical protein
MGLPALLINVFRQTKKLALQKVVKLFLDISHKWERNGQIIIMMAVGNIF